MAAADVEKPPAPVGKDEMEEGEVTPQKEVEAAGPVKHPLEHHWTLWFDNQNKRGGGSWGDSLKAVYTFGTVEDFWCLYNNILTPSKFGPNFKADMHVFKKGIDPKWEDPKCQGGGSWTIANLKSRAQVDVVWLHTILALIGEQLDEGDDVCGVVVNLRTSNKDRVCVWTKSASNESKQMSIGKQLHEILGLNERIVYTWFSDEMKGKGSKARDSHRYAYPGKDE
eukprot:TRINITY_DN19142_c0_g1_i1.p1 TRINITY_DN19142_c0_g1~~TRINITY_DN19142_c0_g1_i1.p1  ORF type:complete len:225 (-),score=53.70 TRINITY_DN19142_c0_g1_i1:247-921(-)